jgi:hypothetical protein
MNNFAASPLLLGRVTTLFGIQKSPWGRGGGGTVKV